MGHAREGEVGQSQFESHLRGLLSEGEETQGQGSMKIHTWDLVLILSMWACPFSSLAHPNPLHEKPGSGPMTTSLSSVALPTHSRGDLQAGVGRGEGYSFAGRVLV